MKNFVSVIAAVFVIVLWYSSVVGAETKTRLDCFNICVVYNKDNKCTKAQKVCYEVTIEETAVNKEIDIITRDLTSPTQSCLSADGKVYKCN
jgi:hypothetical protein